MRIVVGIDPGLAGGVAVLNELDTLETAHLPTIDSDLGRLIDGAYLARWISERDATEAVIELAQSMPDDAKNRAFNYGRTFGQLIAIMQGLLLPITFVRPQQWMKHYGVRREATFDKAKEIWGADRFPLKKDIHRAEAALIARYKLERDQCVNMSKG